MALPQFSSVTGILCVAYWSLPPKLILDTSMAFLCAHASLCSPTGFSDTSPASSWQLCSLLPLSQLPRRLPRRLPRLLVLLRLQSLPTSPHPSPHPLLLSLRAAFFLIHSLGNFM